MILRNILLDTGIFFFSLSLSLSLSLSGGVIYFSSSFLLILEFFVFLFPPVFDKFLFPPLQYFKYVGRKNNEWVSN